MGIIDSILKSVRGSLEKKASGGISGAVEKGFSDALKSRPCPRCKRLLPPPPLPKFCPNCGGALAVTCGSCKSQYAAGTEFCARCGRRLARRRRGRGR
ncbi:MAG: zinc ribbon domain-containing protein [Candidatus Micrarchaeota archaeon]|nr:zinc ribbon domain-containing protein [Candidatus Micrarchaeota archaeon]